jgi:hypothetical protein
MADINPFINSALDYAKKQGLSPEQVANWSRDDILGVCGIDCNANEEEFIRSIKQSVADIRTTEAQAEFTVQEVSDSASKEAIKVALTELVISNPELLEEAIKKAPELESELSLAAEKEIVLKLP